ncbi:hypothetical protein [Flavobacterium pectinovorum]|jgi:hypothetical protein|uniref:Uncharacterized protein n=1 Tax=Flavobacterium pectinovorum TaxID=29533 RepID=A0A502EX31_9FLAO|nr:hypothetical protein [Flavobacterium pectinovorum]TPG42117.1 hypothetical protein EAH81_07295 [Flavobacterium pectinovorum]
MTASELRLYLIQKINNIDDIDLLLKITSLLEEKNYTVAEETSHEVNEPVIEYKKSKTKNIRIFSEAEQKKINLALKQYENGECISDEEAQIELEKWFQEQEK